VTSKQAAYARNTSCPAPPSHPHTTSAHALIMIALSVKCRFVYLISLQAWGLDGLALSIWAVAHSWRAQVRGRGRSVSPREEEG
jgi:hypothetical protein